MKQFFYAVYDTNVLVSALLSKKDSPTVKLLDYVLDERVVLLYNDDILKEYNEVLHRGKFSFEEEDIKGILELVKTGICLAPTESGETFIDADDKVFYEVALSKEDGYIVTGNRKHFPKSPIVVSPSEMVKIIEDSQR